jgi:hypothetical protein
MGVKMTVRIVPMLATTVLLAGCGSGSHTAQHTTASVPSPTRVETSAPALTSSPSAASASSPAGQIPTTTGCPLITAAEVSAVTHQRVVSTNVFATGAECSFKLDGPDGSGVEVAFNQGHGSLIDLYAHDPAMVKVSGIGQDAYYKRPDLFVKAPAGLFTITAVWGSTDALEKQAAIDLFRAAEKHLPPATS